MPQMIKTNGGIFSRGELLRINPNINTIESSSNDGRSWVVRCADSRSFGTFKDLLPFGRDILAVTSKGLYSSSNSARSFMPRCVNTMSYGDSIKIQADGKTLLANTTRRLYYSTNVGRSFMRRY